MLLFLCGWAGGTHIIQSLFSTQAIAAQSVVVADSRFMPLAVADAIVTGAAVHIDFAIWLPHSPASLCLRSGMWPAAISQRV